MCESEPPGGDLFVQPTVKRSKIKERSNFKQAQMAKVAVSMCWPWTNITKC